MELSLSVPTTKFRRDGHCSIELAKYSSGRHGRLSILKLIRLNFARYPLYVWLVTARPQSKSFTLVLVADRIMCFAHFRATSRKVTNC